MHVPAHGASLNAAAGAPACGVRLTPERVMPRAAETRRIKRVLHTSANKKGAPMLEWKARILTLAISLAVVWDQLGVHINDNWNW